MTRNIFSKGTIKGLIAGGMLLGSTVLGNNLYAQSQEEGKRKVDDAQKQAQVTYWYNQMLNGNEVATDSISSLIKRDLYDGSGAGWTAAKDFKIEKIDGKMYAPIDQVSNLNGRFPNAEKEQWLSTTYTSFANASDMTDLELKNAVAMSEQISPEYISIQKDNSGRNIDVLFTGPSDYFKNHVKHKLSTGEILSGHILWDKDQTAIMPVDAALRNIGYNLDATNSYLKIIEDRENELRKASELVDSLKKDNTKMLVDLGNMGNKYTQAKDSLDRTSDMLEHSIARENEYHIIPSYGKTWNSDDWNKKYNEDKLGKDEWSLYSTIPVFDLNSIMIGGGYTKKDMFHGPETVISSELETKANPHISGLTGYSLRERSQKEDLSQDKLFGYIGYEIFDDFYLGPRVEKTVRDGLETFSEKSTTWAQFEGSNERINENTIGPIYSHKKTDKNIWGAGLEAHYNLGRFDVPIDVKAYFTSEFESGATSFGIGAGLDLAQIVRSITK